MTMPGHRCFQLIFVLFTILLASCLFAQSKPRGPTHEVQVPFVGCASDGQTGPVAAPKGATKAVQVDASAVQELAYYQAEFLPGVLAPRGWSCSGVYGSSGTSLFVSPQPFKESDFSSASWSGFGGPAIAASFSNGETSGRFDVAAVIARVFPAHKVFAQSVIKEGLVPASNFPFGPYPSDKLVYLGDRIVEYQTPAHSEGLGTMRWLRANDYPIYGVAILQREGPHLLHLAVRLPPGKNDLAVVIVEQFERDYPVDTPKK